MKYCFDIDGTICSTDSSHDYTRSKPFDDIIQNINKLYEQGHHITLFTARGASSKTDWHDLTVKQLKEWNVKYHILIDQNKPSYDLFVDDKAINVHEWIDKIRKKTIGFLAGAFDIMHPGYIEMFIEAKKHCDILVVGLHSDPTVENKTKLKPVLDVDDRKKILMSLKYVDEVIVYNTEQDLKNIIDTLRPNIRFLGDDYKIKPITGDRNDVKIHFLDRSHGWSTTKFKNLIKNSFLSES